MPDDLTPQSAPRALRPVNAGEPLASPPRESVSLEIANPTHDDESPAERTFETKASRIRLTEEEHQDLATRLENILDAIQHERDERELDANWDLWEDLYFGVLQDRPAGQANVHVPIAQEVVDTALAVVEQAYFTARPWLQIQPREPMDVATAKRKEQFLDYANTVEMLAKEKLDPVLWEAGALGTGVEYLPWLRETDRIRDEETYDGLSEADMERFVTRYPDAKTEHPEVVATLKRGERVTLTVEYDEARQDAPEPTYIPLRDWLAPPPPKGPPPPPPRVGGPPSRAGADVHPPAGLARPARREVASAPPRTVRRPPLSAALRPRRGAGQRWLLRRPAPTPRLPVERAGRAHGRSGLPRQGVRDRHRGLALEAPRRCAGAALSGRCAPGLPDDPAHPALSLLAQPGQLHSLVLPAQPPRHLRDQPHPEGRAQPV